MYATGIAYYQVAIGSYPGGQDILGQTMVGDATGHVVSNLSIAPGYTYYATVWATDYVGLQVCVYICMRVLVCMRRGFVCTKGCGLKCQGRVNLIF